MVEKLTTSRIPLRKVKVNPKKLQAVATKFASYLASDESLKYLAQKAFTCYMRSVHLQSDKTVFFCLKLPKNIRSFPLTVLSLALLLSFFFCAPGASLIFPLIFTKK